METPILETNRLLLHPLGETDMEAYQRHFVDYEIIRNLSSRVPWPYPPDGVKEFIRQIIDTRGSNRWTWGLHLKESGTGLIGCIDLWKPGTPENRGFWLGKKYHGRGLMTEAAEAVNEFAFTLAGFERLVFANADGNIASARVKEKTGCRLLETRPGKFVDPELRWQQIWELKKDDWLRGRKSAERGTC